MSFKFHIICFFLFIGVSISYGQETRKDIERKANTYFEEKNFLEATPLYLRLLSLDPRDHNYNYRYGTCLLFNSKKKQSAFKYLQFAVRGASVDDEAFYYLGKAYHLTYQFKKAITNYEKYMDRAGSRALKNLDVGRQIEMCRNGLSLLSKLSETIVLSKQQIEISDFFRIYDLSNIGGEIIVTEAFQNRQDKRYNHLPIIHFPSNTNRIFYSSYGNSGEHKDIYTRKRLPDGSWSLEQKVKGEINTEYDEDFPYLHPNGRYLYFSSKGHNSMGGFDIFRSKYDPENDVFGKPVNLDFAISSADDDLLYVVDSLNKNAYFASTRESESGKVDVYNVRVERFPMQIAIIKGTFSSKIDPTNKDLSIRIANANTGEKIGDFETSQKGDYLVTLPKGGNYEFTLRVGGKDTDYKQVIEVPYLREFRPLKQKIEESIQNEQEIVLVSNKFDEEFDDPVAIMTEVIKQQSSMEVNKDSYDLDSLDKMKAQREVLAELGLENFSNLEILQLADDKVDNLTQRLETSQNKVLKTQKTIENSKKVIAEAYKRADSLSQLADESSDQEKSSNFHRRANQALQTVKNQQRIIENAEVLESFLTKDIVATEKKLKPAIAFKKKLNAVDRDDDSAFLGVVNDNKKYIADVLLTETLIDAQFEYMDEIESKLVKAEEQKSRIAQLKEQRKQLQNEIATLEDVVNNAKRRKKESLQMELDAKRNQLSDLNNETNYLEKQIEESDHLQDQKDIVSLIEKTDVPEDFKPNTNNESDYDDEKIAKLIKSNDETVEKIDAQSNSEIPKNIRSILNEINSLSDAYTTDNISEQELLSEKKEQLDKLKEKRTNLDEDVISEEQTEYLDEFIELQEKEIDKIEEKIKIRNSSAASDLTVDEKQVLIDQLNEEITELSDQETDNQTKVDARKELVQELEKEIENAEENSSDIDEVPTSQEKDEIIASVDPDYNASVNELKQQAENDPKAQEELLEKQKSFVEELETAINETNEAINNGENPTENKRKKEVLEEKKSQVEQEIAELEKKRDSDTTDVLAVSDSEKAAIIADADKKYKDDINQIQKDIDAGLATDEDLIERKEQHKEELQKALDKTSKKLERNSEDEELHKENQVLTEAIKDVSEEIDQLKETTTPLSEREKDEIIASIDPDYDASVNELKQQAENDPKVQEELLEKQKSFVEELETAINETNEAINNGENPTENKRKKEVLEEKKSQVEQEIAELKKKRDSDRNTDVLEVSDSEKAAIIADADKKYTDDISQLQEDIDAGLATDEDLIERKEKHKEELQKALDKTSKKLERNPEDEELQKENQVLTEAIQDVSEEIDQLKETTPLSESEKDEIIASIDPDYDASINELKQQAENDPKAQDELLEKQKSFVAELETAINETNEAINNGENPTENKRKKEVLEEKKSQVEQEIAELEKKRDSDTTDVLAVSDSEKAAIIADADKKYNDDISQLQEDIDAGLATDENLIERKEQHKEELQKALDKTSKKLERNPEDEELQKENQVLTEAIQDISEDIDQLNVKQQDSILASISDEEKEKVLSKAGGQARIEIGELEQQAKINPAKKPALLEAKKTYLKSLESALVEAEQKLEKNPNDQDSSKEVAILNEEKRKVKIEIGELEKETISDSDYPELADQSLSKATDLTSEELKALEQPTKEIKNLNNQLSALEKIESRLLQMRNDSTDEKEITAIDKKINQIREKSRSVLISIGEVSQEKETIARAITENKEEFSERELKQVEKSVSTISDLEKKKEDLLDEKATTDSERAKKRVQKKIDKATDKITKEEVTILEKTTEKSNEQLNKQLIEEDLAEVTEVDGIGSRKSFNEAEQLLSEAENTKNPEEKKALLVEAQQKQQEAIAQNNDEKRKRRAKILIGDVTKEMGLSNIDPETVSNTKSSIETEQQTIGIKIQEIDEEIAAIEAKISLAKKKDLEELNERKLAFLALKKILAKKFESNELALQEINAQEIADKNDGLSNSALTEKISYEEEVSFAQREEYDELYQISQRLDSKNTEINQKTSELNGLKGELNQLTENIDIDEEANDSKGKAIKSLLTNINETEEELKKLRDVSEKEERKLKETLPTDAKERKIAENLIKRNVTPIEKAPSLPVMSTGIVLTDAKQTYSDENPIPLKPKTPGGLVFRVQIGAFSKPVPNNTFNDFTPVTGEQVRPGLIRYMAGFFPSRDNATEARDKIRGLGYSDAFVVAYCDGERIPVYRAQQLLASGACVPTISSPEKPVYTETEATAEDFDPNTSFEEELDVFAYNKAPGAAEADVAEKIMGLYYTVQVGVYNKPVSASQLKNISPLITKRLENGQMRYSSGIFDNVPDARVKRSEAIELGITDAYIVAYFKGERISVSQARKLIEENGETILESKNPTVVKRNKVSSNTPDVRPEPEPYLKDKSLRVQLESKDNFVLYPTNELNTYNQTDALFYYDKESSTIKSFLYEKDAMPSLKGLENQFSKRLYYNGYQVTDLDAETKSNALSEAEQTKAVLTAKIQFTDLNDELFIFIQKASFLKHIKVQESGIIVTFISNKDDEKIKDAQIHLARFGATELELTEQELAPND